MPSTALISYDSSMIFDLNGRKNKTLNRLNDGDLLSKINDGSNENDFVLPYRSMIVLPNIYGNMKWEQWESFGSGGTFTVRLYNASKTLLGTYSITKSAFNAWVTNNNSQVSTAPLNGLRMEQHTTVRFLEVFLSNATDLNIGVYALRIYGDVTAPATPIYPSIEINTKQDPGKHGHGINVIDDRVQQYLVGSPSTYLTPLMAASLRIGFEGMRFNIYPDSYTGPLDESPVDFGRFGNDHLNTRIFDFTRPRDMEVQIYHGGGSIKNLSAGEAATSNNEYHPEVNDFKYLESGADAEDENNWEGKALVTSAINALFGDNGSVDMTGITVTNGDNTPGQGGLSDMELANEITRDWHGPVPYHNPKAYNALNKKCFDDAEERECSAKSAAAALTFLDITAMLAQWFEHGWEFGFEQPYPIHAYNINWYLNSDLDGQSQSGGSTGLSPEAWDLYDRLVAFKSDVWDRYFPNIHLYVSEYGFATNSDSGYDVPAIGSKTARQVSADLAIRMKAIIQCVPNLIGKMFYYAFFEDGSNNFDSMGATAMTFGGGGSYTGNTVYAQGYALSNEFFVEKNYKWWGELMTNGGILGAWIMVKDHQSDPLKKLFKVWRGTMNGSTGIVAVPVGENAVSATLYTIDYADFEPNSASALISGTNINVVATEGMQWLEVTYEEPEENIPPVANAGADQSITLPTSQVTVNGNGSTDSDGTITTYLWTKISGPAAFNITNPNNVSTTITGLVEGVYVFRLTVTDDNGAQDDDDIQITVNPEPGNVSPVARAGANQTITLPANVVTVNGLASYDPDGTITAYAWSKISGPSSYAITTPSLALTSITGLVEGTYVFRLTVTDNNSGTGTDDITITVLPAPPPSNRRSWFRGSLRNIFRRG